MKTKDYTTLGYDKALNKESPSSSQMSSAEFSLSVDGVDASKITQGISKGTKLGLDYDKGFVTVNEGNTTRIVTGKFTDGKFGMRVYDSSGNVVVDSTA